MFVGLFTLLISPFAVESALHGSISRRIVKGFEVDIKSFPYAVFLYFNTARPSTCGSSLITVRAVVTSAHCMDELSVYKGAIHAFLGATIPMYSKVVRNITEYKIHPKYNPRKGKFDLSVAKFDKVVPIMHGISKIPIYRKSIKDNDIMYTVGWGKKWPNVIPDFSDARGLQASKQRLVSIQECFNMSGIKISTIFLCSVPVKGFHYRGDLGNGLVTTKPHLALLGVVSFMVKDVTLYANVMHQREWLCDSLKALYHTRDIDEECY